MLKWRRKETSRGRNGKFNVKQFGQKYLDDGDDKKPSEVSASLKEVPREVSFTQEAGLVSDPI